MAEADGEKDAAMLKAIRDLQGFSEKKIVGVTELMRAAATGETLAVSLAIESAHDGVTITADDVDYEGRTALHVAAAKGWIDVVNLLINTFQVRTNPVDHAGQTPLQAAVRNMHVDCALAICKAGGDLRWDETTAAGELCEAAKHGNSDKIELMISCGISVNAADYDKRSALHLACSVGNKAVCEQLISARANVNARDRWKNTPLRDAIREGHRELARWMHVHGAQLKMTRNDMAGELCEYAHKGDVESIKVLTTCGCDVDASDYDARTCLHLASSVGNKQICDHLLSCGASINAKDRWVRFLMPDPSTPHPPLIPRSSSRVGREARHCQMRCERGISSWPST